MAEREPLTDKERAKKLMDKLLNDEQDYINIRIPKKGDVPIVEFKGKSYGQLPDQALESLKLLWVTDSHLETTPPERFSLDIVYLDKDHRPIRSAINVGDSLATDSNICRVAEANSED